MIIKNIATVKNYVGINADMNYMSIKPYLRSAEQNYIIPLVGKEIYDVLNNAVNSEDPLSPALTALLPYFEAPIATLAVLAYIPTGNVIISDNGIFMSEETNLKPAALWAKEELQEFLKTTGYADLEALVDFLIDNSSDYPAFVAADAYKKFRGHFVSFTSEFNEIYDINASYRTFSRIKSVCQNIENDTIKDLLGEEYFDELIEKITDGDTTPDDKKIIPMVQRAIVFLAIAEACETLPIEFTDEGLVIRSVSSNNVNRLTNSAPQNSILIKKNYALSKGKEYLSEAKNYLNKNASSIKYTTYFNSSAYTNPANITITNNDINDKDSKIYLM